MNGEMHENLKTSLRSCTRLNATRFVTFLGYFTDDTFVVLQT